MKKSKLLILCAVLLMGTMFVTACGSNRNNGDTQAPYEDETNNDVNGTNNGTNDTTNGMNNDMDSNVEDTSNSGAVNDLQRGGNNLKDAGRNLVDSIQDAGSAIMDGVDNMGNNANSTNRNGR